MQVQPYSHKGKRGVAGTCNSVVYLFDASGIAWHISNYMFKAEAAEGGWISG